jgi:DNA polymerase elongation subunit (family B)
MKYLMDWYLDYYDNQNGINKNMQNQDNRKKLYDKIFNTIYENMENTKYHFHVVYGDTDSIMVSMDLANSEGIRYKELEMRKRYINMGNLGSDIINEFLPPPENLEYEKILTPFTILSKKRYVGNLYEQDPNKFYQKNMGIVLKRRDNSRIVKYVVGGVVNKLINTTDLNKGKQEALEYAQQCLYDIIDGKYDINMFILSKSLREKYRTKTDPSHVALAKKMALRDPGNAPAVNDRIQYVFIVVDESKAKTQGDRVETPEYILENHLQIDYKYYIKKQIETPCKQFLDLFNKEEATKIFNRAYDYFDKKQAGLKFDDKSILLKINKVNPEKNTKNKKNNGIHKFSIDF